MYMHTPAAGTASINVLGLKLAHGLCEKLSSQFLHPNLRIYITLPGCDESYLGLVSSPCSRQQAGLANAAATVYVCHNGDWARSSRIIDAMYYSVCIPVG